MGKVFIEMNDRFKFRYVWKHKDTGEIKFVIHDLQTIESTNPVLGLQMEGWRLISRDFSTGLKSNSDKLIFERDFVDFTYWWFDGNEAESHLQGEIVYLENLMSFGLKHVKNSDWCKHTGADREVGDTDAFGVWTFDEADFEIIGNSHKNPELLNDQNGKRIEK
jgi:hypothetical protein